MPKPLLAAFAVFLLAIGLVLGFGVGSNKSQPRWYDTPATVSVEAKKASFDSDGYVFGIQGSVAWIDEAGELHDGGWPDCLNDHTTHARFLSTPRVVEDIDVRPVLAVDCR